MALNPVAYTENVVRSFLRYQLTAYPFSDPRLHAQMRALLSLDETRRAVCTMLGCPRGAVGKRSSPVRARCHRPVWPGGQELRSSRQGIEGA